MAKTKGDSVNHYHLHRDLPRSSLTSASTYRRRARNGKQKKQIIENTQEASIRKLTPDQVYDFIGKRLNIKNFFSLGVSCKIMYDMFNNNKANLLSSQAPQCVLISSHAKRACFLYDMSTSETHKAMLPTLVGKFYIGCSSGFIILENQTFHISLFNPLSKHHIEIPPPPCEGNQNHGFLHDRIIVASTRPQRKDDAACTIVLALAPSMHFLQVYHSKYDYWFNFKTFGGGGYLWVDMVVMKNQIYGLTYKGEISVLKILGKGHTYGMFKRPRAVNPLNIISCDTWLVVDEDQLWMIEFKPEKKLDLYRLKEFEDDSYTWIKEESLEDKALFFGGKKGSCMRKASIWGGRNNCVYAMNSLCNVCNIYSMQAQLIESFPIVETRRFNYSSTLMNHSWYFPHQSLQIEYLLDE